MPTTFAELGLDPALVETLTALGYEEPTPIQTQAIPSLLAGRDLLGQAATGTGKTAAFALPLLQRFASTPPAPSRPSIMVLVPTRELAMQVAQAFHKYGRAFGALVVPVYGGQPFEQQIRALRRGVHVVVATPGRALDHLRRKTLNLDGLVAIVLDEADEMLDMGFADEIESILGQVPPSRQSALFSATMPPRIASIAGRHLNDPVRIMLGREETQSQLPKVRQTAYIVGRAHKVTALGRILDLEMPELALVFCRTRTEVDELAETLTGRGYHAEALHGGMTQDQRDRVMKRTRGGTVDLLIATDVAARGLDIEQITHVINFNVPDSPSTYVHRIGRTGRAGREGVAITIAEPREHRMLRNIEVLTKQRLTVAQLPTVIDVRARQLDVTRESIREAIVAGQTEGYRVVVESLTEDFDVMEIAMAAVQLAHTASNSGTPADDEEIPAPTSMPRKGERALRPKTSRGSGMARIYIGAGRKNNLRPADVVGAIAGEAKVDAGLIGTIEIADRYAIVEIPDELAETVVKALRAGRIKGKRLTVRRDMATGR